jgi:UDP-N-acetylmuramoylalanine--D-glutamate ligase
MTPVRGYAHQRIGVLGLGRSGLATAQALAAGNAIPVCWDDQEDGRARAAEHGFEVADLANLEIVRGLFKVILSPGAAHLYPQPHPVSDAAMKAGTPIDNDIGLFFEAVGTANAARPNEPKHRIIAITGSNGKSTTSMLTHHLLTYCGHDVQLGGNIGESALTLAAPRPGGVTVLELSSYQLAVARRLAPDVGVLLNIQPDHCDRHGGIGGYFAAKERLFAAPNAMTSVVGVSDLECRWLANRLDERHRRQQLIRLAADESELMRRGVEFLFAHGAIKRLQNGVGAHLAELSTAPALNGSHNAQNAAAAFAAAMAIGAQPDKIAEGLPQFKGLDHRMQIVARHQDVTYVNDSKATNAAAAARALASFSNIRWIAGGRAKDGGVSGLNEELHAVRKAYLIGESALLFRQQLTAKGVSAEICGELNAAVQRARKDAEPGDVILLSPAAASFDQFQDFETRGAAFAELVDALMTN